MAAKATDRAWGVWLVMDPHSSLNNHWCFDHLEFPVTYQEAIAGRNQLLKKHPECSYEVREVPLSEAPCSSASAEQEKPWGIKGRYLGGKELWMRDANNKELIFDSESTAENYVSDYMKVAQWPGWTLKVTRFINRPSESGFHTINAAAPSPEPVGKKPYLPPRLQERPLPFLIGGELLTNQEELAKLLFRTDPSILSSVSRVVDFASPDSLSFEAALEKAWELGKAAAAEPMLHELPLPPLALERSRYQFATERAAAIFALLSSKK